MSGFGVQKEPFFTDKLNRTVSSLLEALKDPALPLMEMRVRKRQKIDFKFCLKSEGISYCIWKVKEQCLIILVLCYI